MANEQEGLHEERPKAQGESKASQWGYPFPSRFKPVKETRPVVNYRRDPPGCKVHKSGLADVNTQGSVNLLDMVRRAGFTDPTHCGALLAPDVDTHEVAGAIVPPDTPGVTPIRRGDDGTLTLYLHDVFAQHPTLVRPPSDAWVAMTFKPDEGYFIIHLKLMLSRRTQRRRKRNDGDQAPPKAAEAQPAPAEDEELEEDEE